MTAEFYVFCADGKPQPVSVDAGMSGGGQLYLGLIQHPHLSALSLPFLPLPSLCFPCFFTYHKVVNRDMRSRITFVLGAIAYSSPATKPSISQEPHVFLIEM